MKRDGIKRSAWQNTPTIISLSTAELTDGVFDAIIIGAGITGLTTALLLQNAGKNCLVLEKYNIGFGTTGGTTAHINTFFDLTYPEIEDNFGKEASKIVAQGAHEAIDLIKYFVNRYQIDCDLELKPGYLYSENEKETQQLETIHTASLRAGVAVSESETNDLPIPFEKALKFEGQYQFHPIKYVNGLAQAFIANGGHILEGFAVTDTQQENDLNLVTADEKVFKCKDLIFATHVPPGLTKFNVCCAAYRSYVLGVELADASQYPNGLTYELKDVYHYFRTHQIDGKKILIIGGADHKTGQGEPEEAFQELEAFATSYFNIQSIPYKWSSQYYIPIDGLPYIGASEDHIYVATGYNGNGMVWGTLASKIILDSILEKENQLAKLLDPLRVKPIAGFSDFVKENADAAYHFVADRFGVEEIESLKVLTREEGKIVEFDGKKIAAYKDKHGLLKILNPTCTHMGCIVNFNKAEMSWDCPCHGGRFDLDGNVICGPPLAPLKDIS